MTSRFFVACCALAVTALCALSLGGRVFYLVSWALFLMVAYAALSTLLSRRTLTLHQSAGDTKLERGDSSTLYIRVQSRSPLPIAPLGLRLSLPEGTAMVQLDAGAFKESQASFPFFTPHVGVEEVGVKNIWISDLFGFFRLHLQKGVSPVQVAVLPRFFEVEKLHIMPQDDGRALPNRASEDITSPEDTRNYVQGDALKRIHWKLSSRKRELLVRRFEVPAPPDTLILMDCSEPLGAKEAPDGLSRLKDTLCETALSVAKMQMEDGQSVRMPLYGARAGEFKADRTGSLNLLQEELAYQIFRGGEPLPKVLNVELRRMRRTGATVVVTTRLDAQVVEGVKHIRRSGPSVRLYLVTFRPDDAQYLPFVQQMQRHLVEVCYVTPA